MAPIKRSKEMLETLQRLYAFGEGGEVAFTLHLFGDHLADREGYQGLDGQEAVCFYLMQKHGWLPAQVRAMSYSDRAFALHQELRPWLRPVEACGLGILLPAVPHQPSPKPRRKPR